MNNYRVLFSQTAWKVIMRLDEKTQDRIFAVTDDLELDPRPSGCKKLKGDERAYRVRVGDLRILYDIYDDVLVIVVLEVGNRNKVYKRKK